MLYNLGSLMVRWKWLVIALWTVAFLLAGVLAPQVFSTLKSGFGRADTESQRAQTILVETLGASEAILTLVFSHDTLLVTSPEFKAAVEGTIAEVAQDPAVSQIVTIYNSGQPTMASDDGHTTYVLLALDATIDQGMDLYPDIREQMVAPDGFQFWVTGGIPIFSNLNTAAEEDLQRSEAVSLPVVLVALALVFGSLVATVLPVAMAAIAVVMTMALVFLLGQVMDVSIFVLNIATFLGIGISIDYTLLIVNRFREELPGRDRADAVGVTLATAGKAILFSGLTTVVGLSGMMLIPFMFFRSLGLGGVTVVIISVALTLTLVPAVLGALGERINSLRVIPSARGPRGIWRGIAQRVMRRPLLVAVSVSVFLLVLGIPFLSVKIGAPWAAVLPRDAEARLGWEHVEASFGPGELSPVVVVAQAPDGVLLPDTVGVLYDFAQRMATDPRVERVESIVTLDPSITREQYQQMYASPSNALRPEVRAALAEMVGQDVTFFRVFLAVSPVSDEGKALVEDIRAEGVGSGVVTLVTGATADLDDSVSLMYRNFPLVIAYILAVTFIVLLVLFRSVVLPVKAVIMNGMSIFASYGALVFIFQQGHFENLLGFRSVGFTEATVPIIMFGIIFGLSMDYEVFLLMRVKEAYDETGDNTESVAIGLERTGRVITSAALILVLVAAAFATSDVIVVKAFGVGVAIAILLDATLVRALLVPALMRLMGDWNWWAPRWLLRILPGG